MAIMPEDLQPETYKVTLHGKEYLAYPPRLSHRIILKKVQPFFIALQQAAEDDDVTIPSDKLIEYEKELDIVFQSLVPELKNVTLGVDDVISLLMQIVDQTLPQETRELIDNKVVVGEPDPKVTRTGS